MSTINTLKKIADMTIGNLNKSSKFLLQQMDPGNKNLFLMIMYPKVLDDIGLGLKETAMAVIDIVADTLVATVNLRSIDMQFLSIEYEAYGELKGAKKINYPDTITFSILEDEYGTMKNYLYKWLGKIVFPVDESDGISGISRVNYVFADNQEGAKKNAILISQSGLGIPSLRPIRMYGLKFQSLNNITYGHGEGDPLIFDVTCAVDSVWFGPLF